ncbi:hypothetical protein BDW67DRAFT_81233 [Aspergillus spinulosporus]
MDPGSLPLLPLLDMDFLCPLNLVDAQFSPSTWTSRKAQSPEAFTQTSTQILLVKSFLIRLEMECPYERAFEPSSQHSFNSRATVLCPPPHAASENVLRSYHFSLRLFKLLTLRFFLTLHHPFMIRARKDSTFCFSRNVSLGISLSLLTKFTVDANPVPGEKDYYHLALIGTGIFFQRYWTSRYHSLRRPHRPAGRGCRCDCICV